MHAFKTHPFQVAVSSDGSISIDSPVAIIAIYITMVRTALQIIYD